MAERLGLVALRNRRRSGRARPSVPHPGLQAGACVGGGTPLLHLAHPGKPQWLARLCRMARPVDLDRGSTYHLERTLHLSPRTPAASRGSNMTVTQLKTRSSETQARIDLAAAFRLAEY